MTLSDADLRGIAARQEPRVLLHHEVVKFARAIEAEARKQDESLILMLVERLERADKISGYANNKAAIKAGRARLEDMQ